MTNQQLPFDKTPDEIQQEQHDYISTQINEWIWAFNTAVLIGLVLFALLFGGG